MATNTKQRISVWILGFLTFLGCLNTFNGALLWTIHGAYHLFEPYFINQYIGNMQVDQYFWLSLTLSFVFLGLTVVAIFHRSYDDLIKTSNSQKKILEKFFDAFRTNLKSHEHLENHITMVKAEVSEALVAQEATVASHIVNMKREVLGALGPNESLENLEKRVERISRTLDKVRINVAHVRNGLTSLEATLVLPKPILRAESSPKEIKGIGPKITEELAGIGITNAGEFLIADPILISEKTHLTQEKAERLQGMIQLLMIPAINETDIELLEKAGVTNRIELAMQDPFKLNIKLLEIAKAYIEDRRLPESERPTLEEIMSWIGVAKL